MTDEHIISSTPTSATDVQSLRLNPFKNITTRRKLVTMRIPTASAKPILTNTTTETSLFKSAESVLQLYGGATLEITNDPLDRILIPNTILTPGSTLHVIIGGTGINADVANSRQLNLSTYLYQDNTAGASVDQTVTVNTGVFWSKSWKIESDIQFGLNGNGGHTTTIMAGTGLLLTNCGNLSYGLTGTSLALMYTAKWNVADTDCSNVIDYISIEYSPG